MLRQSTIPSLPCEQCSALIQPHNRIEKRRFCSYRCMGDHKRQSLANCEPRFWERMDRTDTDGCWPWAGSKNNYGYGEIYIDQRKTGAHRVAWMLTHGNIPDGLIVCHHCDNPPCCRPDHLFLGTDADNAQDKIRKGRQGRGEILPISKLTADDVRAIRVRYAQGGISQERLGREYGVTQGAVRMLLARLTWRHIE